MKQLGNPDREMTARAVAILQKNARAEEVSHIAQANRVGKNRQTIGEHYQRGDMPLSEFIAISHQVGTDPAALLKEAAAETQGKASR